MNVHIIENGVVTNTVVISSVVAAEAIFTNAICTEATEGQAGWLWDGNALSAPPVDLSALKSAKNAEINAARLAANFSSFEYGGKTFATDQLSRSDIDGINGYISLYDALPAGWPGAWKAMDNTYLPIADVAAWKLFYSAMVGAGNANFAKAQGLKTTLAAATTPEQVAAIQW